MPPRPGDILDVRVDRIAYGGQGVARVDDFVVFVAGAVPGDTARVRVVKRKSSYAQARLLEILAPSAVRVQHACPHGSECGGCEWRAIDYAAQLRFKQAQVVESLQHIAGLRAGAFAPADVEPGVTRTAVPAEPPSDQPEDAARPLNDRGSGYTLEAIRGMAAPWRYRNKMEFSFGETPAGTVLGLHRRGSWREIVEIDDCLLAPEPIARARQAVIAACRALDLRAFGRETHEGLLRHLVVRHALASGDLAVNLFVSRRFAQEKELVTRVRAGCELTSFAITVNETPADAAVGDGPHLLYGPPYLRETLAGVQLHVPLSAFLQTNSRMCEVLYGIALRWAAADVAHDAWDLYCGIGSISLALARGARRVDAVELQPEAIEAAHANADLNHVSNVAFRAGDVRRLLKDLTVEEAPAVVVTDPPRAGMSRKALARAAALGAARFVYVSCNPTTLAGDAIDLVEAGYRLTRVAPVDMFPHTHHIETVALFERD